MNKDEMKSLLLKKYFNDVDELPKIMNILKAMDEYAEFVVDNNN